MSLADKMIPEESCNESEQSFKNPKEKELQTLKNKILNHNFSDVLNQAQEAQKIAKKHGLVSFGPKLSKIAEKPSKTQSRVNSNSDLLCDDSDDSLSEKKPDLTTYVSPRLAEYNAYRNQDKLERHLKLLEIGSVSTKNRMKQVITSEEQYNPQILLDILKM